MHASMNDTEIRMRLVTFKADDREQVGVTPGGVFARPQRMLRDGDVVPLGIQALGTPENVRVAERCP